MGFCPESDRAAQKIRGAAQKIRGAARRFCPPNVINRLKRAPGLESWSLIYSTKTITGLKLPVFNGFYVYTTYNNAILVELSNDRRVFVRLTARDSTFPR